MCNALIIIMKIISMEYRAKFKKRKGGHFSKKKVSLKRKKKFKHDY